ncbi:MAG: hypothetical protein IPN74_20095 [Haliscomenobacter sp.]|nr:hypothetical protein [Haliscomenobacter sp.]
MRRIGGERNRQALQQRYAERRTDCGCYKIFRTFTVINWCQYDERCGEPMQWAVVVPRDPNNNGTNWNDGGGVNVLVRDTDMDRNEEIYYEDEDGNVAYPNDAVNWANKGPKTVSSDDKKSYDDRGESYPQTCEYASYGNNGSEARVHVHAVHLRARQGTSVV